MPRKKRFEGLKFNSNDIQDNFTIEYFNMFEAAKSMYENIETILQHLDDDEEVVFEIPEEKNSLYTIWKSDDEFYYSVNQNKKIKLEAGEVLFLLFRKAPHITVIAVSN